MQMLPPSTSHRCLHGYGQIRLLSPVSVAHFRSASRDKKGQRNGDGQD
uniref:Uncharacterized protein n=1 Tax=Anguilla anguilla TaxID=7936 RepID=A0A0E9R8F7_ANGAN